MSNVLGATIAIVGALVIVGFAARPQYPAGLTTENQRTGLTVVLRIPLVLR